MNRRLEPNSAPFVGVFVAAAFWGGFGDLGLGVRAVGVTDLYPQFAVAVVDVMIDCWLGLLGRTLVFVPFKSRFKRA